MERLQKVIANSGVASRRKAEELILKGKVKVNGEIVREMGIKVSENDNIEVNGEFLEKEDKVYFLLNKPRGVISAASDDKNRKTVVDLIDTDKRIYPVGRLDYDTTGLLILTNDGELANYLMHPKNEIDKLYVAKIKGRLEIADLKKMESGVKIDDYITSPCKIKIRKYDKETNTSMVEVTIHEGHNHQVKNMFGAVKYDVVKLKRERVGFLTLDNLKSGEYRELTIKEIRKLYDITNN